MKLIKTNTDFYSCGSKGNDFLISVNDECFNSDSELLFTVKPMIPDKWFSPADYKLFMADMLKSITELEILYYGKEAGN